MAGGTQEESGQRGGCHVSLNSPSWPDKIILFTSDFIWLFSQSVSEEIPFSHLFTV